jgi:hypothetical protein
VNSHLEKQCKEVAVAILEASFQHFHGCNGKGKVHPRTGHEGPEGGKRYSSTLSLAPALDEVCGQHHAPASLPPGKIPGTHCLGDWVGPRGGLEGCRKSLLLPGFDPRAVKPVASRYTDYAIPAHIFMED